MSFDLDETVDKAATSASNGAAAGVTETSSEALGALRQGASAGVLGTAPAHKLWLPGSGMGMAPTPPQVVRSLYDTNAATLQGAVTFGATSSSNLLVQNSCQYLQQHPDKLHPMFLVVADPAVSEKSSKPVWCFGPEVTPSDTLSFDPNDKGLRMPDGRVVINFGDSDPRYSVTSLTVTEALSTIVHEVQHDIDGHGNDKRHLDYGFERFKTEFRSHLMAGTAKDSNLTDIVDLSKPGGGKDLAARKQAALELLCQPGGYTEEDIGPYPAPTRFYHANASNKAMIDAYVEAFSMGALGTEEAFTGGLNLINSPRVLALETALRDEGLVFIGDDPALPSLDLIDALDASDRQFITQSTDWQTFVEEHSADDGAAFWARLERPPGDDQGPIYWRTRDELETLWQSANERLGQAIEAGATRRRSRPLIANSCEYLQQEPGRWRAGLKILYRKEWVGADSDGIGLMWGPTLDADNVEAGLDGQQSGHADHSDGVIGIVVAEAQSETLVERSYGQLHGTIVHEVQHVLDRHETSSAHLDHTFEKFESEFRSRMLGGPETAGGRDQIYSLHQGLSPSELAERKQAALEVILSGGDYQDIADAYAEDETFKARADDFVASFALTDTAGGGFHQYSGGLNLINSVRVDALIDVVQDAGLETIFDSKSPEDKLTEAVKTLDAVDRDFLTKSTDWPPFVDKCVDATAATAFWSAVSSA